MNNLEKLLRSPQGRQMLADETRREAEERASQIRKLEQEVAGTLAEQAAANDSANARIDVLRTDFEEVQIVYLAKQGELNEMIRQRIQRSFSADAALAELRSELDRLEREAV